MKYMLDTNICIYVIKHKPEKVLQKFMSVDPNELCISSITLAELEHGVYKSMFPERNQAALMLFLSNLKTMPFDDRAAEAYGEIRAYLEKSGSMIGVMDMLIAGHAKSLDMVLVTNNTREFDRVKGLIVENWC